MRYGMSKLLLYQISKPEGSQIKNKLWCEKMYIMTCAPSEYSVIATDKTGYPHDIFLISPRNICCGYSLEAPHWGASNEYQQHTFSSRNKKDIRIFRIKKAPYLLLCCSWNCLIRDSCLSIVGNEGPHQTASPHSFVETDHEIFSTVVLSLPLIQEGQLSVSGERMCTILVNHLED